MKKLFFDLETTGHHTEYISHLVNHFYENNDDNEYFFVVHPNFFSQFPDIVKKAKCVENITWIQVTSLEYEKCIRAKLIKKSFAEFQLVNRYALLYKVNHVCLLYFNTFQIAVWFYRPSYCISGILFLQFFRMSKYNWKDKFRYYRKYITTLLYSLNPKIIRIFILNDKKSVVYFNHEFNTDIFEMLPDPIPDLEPLPNFEIYKHYNISENRKIFLHIGALGDRKGTFEIIETLYHFSKDIENKIAILLVGKADSKDVEDLILDKIAEVMKNPNITIVWDNQFVSNQLMKSLFNQCYAVLMPYKNSEASSGILGHAAASNKLVISTGKGLLKEIIENNKLGLLIENVSSNEIALQMRILLSDSKPYNFNKSNDFVSLHKPVLFAKQIIN